MKRIPPLPLTREHGSWAVMAVPLLVGTFAADRLLWEHAALIVAALSAFLSYVPAQILLGRSAGRRVSMELSASAQWWMPILPSIALSSVAWIALSCGWAVLVWGGVALLAFAVHHRLTQRIGKSLWGDLSATVGLSAGAPAALMLGAPEEWPRAILLWALVAAFFGSSVFYVHMKIRSIAEKASALSWPGRLQFGWMTLAYHVAVVGLVAAIVAAGNTGRLAVLAYLPMTVHAITGTVRMAHHVSFKRLGFVLLGHSLLFALLMTLAWRHEA